MIENFNESSLSNEQSKNEELILPAVEIPVFFASNRKTISSNKDADGKTLADLYLGQASVRVPAQSRWYEAPHDLSDDLETLGWRLNEREATLKPYLEIRGYVAESNTKAVLRNIHKEESRNFWKELNQKVNESKEHKVYVYIHGFASSGENALYTAGVLASQVEAPVLAFTWPSAGKVGWKLFGPNSTRGLFKTERKLVDNPQVLNDLASLLSDMKKNLPENTKIEIVAHSLGNRLLTRYLDSDAKEKFDSVYFLAPDVDKKMFLSAVPDIVSKANYVGVFMNPQDKVLGVSSMNNLLELKSARKLGRANIAAPGIEFINYGEIAAPKRIGHYIPFEHFGSIARTGLPYSQDPQSQQYFLFRRTKIEKQPKELSKDKSKSTQLSMLEN